jgi:hydroxymethylglutaryl-CoA reductase
MGVVGPMRVRRKYDDEDVYVPLATTEAALVASTNRGCAALREAGGAVVRVEDVGMTRAPVFRTSGIVQTQQFLQWIKDHEEELRAVTESTSRHLKLLEIRSTPITPTSWRRSSSPPGRIRRTWSRARSASPASRRAGGTQLDTQREALALLGVAPDPERPGEAVMRLAEILGAVVLAGELSLMAAFTSQDLARAHENLARGGSSIPSRSPAR